MIVNSITEIEKFVNVDNASYVGKPVNNTVMYASKKVEHLLNNLKSVENCVVFIEETVVVPTSVDKNNFFIRTKKPQSEYAKYVKKIYEKRMKRESVLAIKLTKEGYYLSEDAKIGKNANIEPGAYIGHNVVIGDNASIKSGAILKNTIAGNNLVVCENATIGTTGFTMADDENGNKTRIPTLGGVIVGNDVEIGSLTNVSCGSAGNTIISDNVKLDSLVHVGHDASLGKNVELPAGAIIGGFAELGDNSFVSINATVRNRIKIGESAFVGMGAVVTKSVDSNTTVVGNPAKVFVK